MDNGHKQVGFVGGRGNGELISWLAKQPRSQDNLRSLIKRARQSWRRDGRQL